jgi:urea transport system permease protein
LFAASAVTLLLVYGFCRWLRQTKFGLVQQAIRDGENRVLFSGYATAHYKLFVFVLAALIAAIGGALYVPQVGIINPGEMQADKSLEAVVWVAVGGRGTLLGPIVGAVGVNALKSWAVRAFPDLWYIILGGLFILVVLFLPGGLVSIPKRLAPVWKRFRKTNSTDETAPVEPTDLKPEAASHKS